MSIEAMPSEPLRTYPLTKPLTWLAVVCLRASPLLLAATYSHKFGISPIQWVAAFVAALAIQAVFFLVERRCASPEIPYHRGLFVVGASVSTGWSYFDVFLVLGSVISAQLISCGFALTATAPARYSGLVRWFYRNRVER